MSKIKAILLSLILCSNSLATECLVPVKTLEEGNISPCKGFLFSPVKELEVRLMKKDYELYKLELETTNAIIDRYKKKEYEFEKVIELESKKADLWKTRAEDITLKYITLEDTRGKRDLMFVLAGVGLTVLAGYAIGQAAQGLK